MSVCVDSNSKYLEALELYFVRMILWERLIWICLQARNRKREK